MTGGKGGVGVFEQLRFLIIDLKRWNSSSLKDIFYMFFEQAIWGTIFYRLSRALFLVNVPIMKIFLRFIGFFIFKISESFFGVAIRPGAEIGPGLYVGHAGMVMINEEVKAGKNLSVGPGVLIGLRGVGHKGAPVLGNDVYVGVGAKILGKINVGDNVRIGANSVVVQNVPSSVTVFGVPAKVVGPAFNFKKSSE
jgi:serine O-acetyltransferase